MKLRSNRKSAFLIAGCVAVVALSAILNSLFMDQWFRYIMNYSLSGSTFSTWIKNNILFAVVHNLPINLMYLIGGVLISKLTSSFYNKIIFAACLGVVGCVFLYYPFRPASIHYVLPPIFSIIGVLGATLFEQRKLRRGREANFSL